MKNFKVQFNFLENILAFGIPDSQNNSGKVDFSLFKSAVDEARMVVSDIKQEEYHACESLHECDLQFDEESELFVGNCALEQYFDDIDDDLICLDDGFAYLGKTIDDSGKQFDLARIVTNYYSCNDENATVNFENVAMSVLDVNKLKEGLKKGNIDLPLVKITKAEIKEGKIVCEHFAEVNVNKTSFGIRLTTSMKSERKSKSGEDVRVESEENIDMAEKVFFECLESAIDGKILLKGCEADFEK